MSNPAGVPPLGETVAFTVVAAAITDFPGILSVFGAPPWGIIDQTSGQYVILGDSVVGVDLTQDAQNSRYPTEQGGFETYNKVQLPRRMKYTYTKGGSPSVRAQFMSSIDALEKSLALLGCVTPEGTIMNMNLDHYDVRRTERHGVTLLTVDVWLDEIRQAPSLQFATQQQPAVSNPATPDAADPQNDGTVQSTVPGYQTNTAGTTVGTSTTPATIQTPSASLTDGAGNTPPVSQPDVQGAQITYNGNDGPASGVVDHMSASGLGYVLTNGQAVGKSLVTSYTPPNFTPIM